MNNLLKCATCGHVTSRDYVAMADRCPRCGTSPFSEAERHDRPTWFTGTFTATIHLGENTIIATPEIAAALRLLASILERDDESAINSGLVYGADMEPIGEWKIEEAGV